MATRSPRTRTTTMTTTSNVDYYYGGNAALFSFITLATTFSVAFAITALIEVTRAADPAVNQQKQYITIGMALNIVAWVLLLIAAGSYDSGMRRPGTRNASLGVLVIAFLFLVAGSALLLTAATQIDRVALRALYIFTMTAGIVGIIAAGIAVIQWIVMGVKIALRGSEAAVGSTMNLFTTRTRRGIQ